MSFKTFFMKSTETHPNGMDDTLKTHYYNNQYEAVKRAVIDVCNRNNYEIVNIDDRYKEIFVQGSKSDLIFTCLEETPSVTSINIKINTYYGLACGRCYKTIQSMFEQLNQKLFLNKIGGHYGG